MDAMMYKIEGEDLYLIELLNIVWLVNLKIKSLKKLKNYHLQWLYSPCFRKEVGAHGIEERGIYRVHQFENKKWRFYKPEEAMNGMTKCGHIQLNYLEV